MESFLMFRAFDKSEHGSAAVCRAYERRNAHRRLIGLTEAQVNAALGGEDPELAEAIELVGSRLARSRLAGGDLKRRPNGEAAPKQITHQPEEAGDAPGSDNGDAGDNEFASAEMEGAL